MNVQSNITKCLIVLSLLWAGTSARSQYRDWAGSDETPETSRWVPKLKYFEIDMDAERDTYQTTVGGKQETTHLYMAPRLGVGWDNYIYHPSLFNYSALLEPGYMWRQTTESGQKYQTDQTMLDGRLTAELLSVKPYATTFTFNRSHQDVRYGFYNTTTVDAQNWGVSTGYREGPVPFKVSFYQTREDGQELTQRTINEQSILDFQARNERKNDAFTDLAYQYAQYDRRTESLHSSFANQNFSHHVTVQDIEHFEQSVLKSSFRFTTREAKGATESDLTAAANYDLELTPRLHNYDQGTFSQFSGDGYDSRQLYAGAGLRHELYESLTSTLGLNGNRSDSSSAGSSTDSTSGGITVSEDYTKRLGSWGRLSLGGAMGYNLNSQNSGGGGLLVPNESHAVPINNLVKLTHTRTVAVISVTDSNAIPLDPADFLVISATDPWQIQINPFGPSHIQPGAIIQVTYTIQNNPSATSSTFSDSFQIRLSFWDEMAALYARYSATKNQASSADFVVENDEVMQAGASFTWRHLSLNADYTDQRSTFFTLKSFNLGENYSMAITDGSTLGINLSQQWAVNTSGSGLSTNQTQRSTFYNFMLNYDLRPLPQLTWRNEVGYQRQTGFNTSQNLLAARTYLNWLYGKIQVNLGYEHQDLDFRNEKRQKDYVFLKFRRNF